MFFFGTANWQHLKNLEVVFLLMFHNLEGDELQSTMTDVYYLMEFLDGVDEEQGKRSKGQGS